MKAESADLHVLRWQDAECPVRRVAGNDSDVGAQLSSRLVWSHNSRGTPTRCLSVRR
jgi:hypothetical protein